MFPAITRSELTVLFYECLYLAGALVTPLLFKLALDKGIGKRDAFVFIVLGVAGLSMFVILALARMHSRIIKERMRFRLSFELKKYLLETMLYMPLPFIAKNSLSRKFYNIDRDTEGAVSVSINTFAQFIMPLFRVVAFLLFFAWLDVHAALGAVLLAPLLIFLIRFYSGKRQQIQKLWIKDRIKLNKLIFNSFLHQIIIKVFGKERKVRNMFLRRMISNVRLALAKIRTDAFGELAVECANRLAVFAVTVWCGLRVISGGMSLGTMAAVIMYTGLFVASLRTLGTTWGGLLMGFVSLENIGNLLRERQKRYPQKGRIALNEPEGRINIKDLSFSYGEKTVLNRVNMYVKPGMITAVVGPSGVGKTTLIYLILGALSPDRGDIFIDDKNIKDIDFNSLLGKTGICLQEPYLFEASIKDNIRFFDDGFKDEDIEKAADIVLASEYISGLKSGYDNIIGESGAMLSHGQKQKIALARAIVKKPRLLILDEATSSLSGEEEASVFLNIKEAGFVRTTLLISHRPATVRHADFIYVLRDGKISGSGSFDYLRQNEKSFSEFFRIG
jgi:ATP-binding cassette subfamily B protein